jgi:hypothetical protein
MKCYLYNFELKDNIISIIEGIKEEIQTYMNETKK